MDVGHLPLLAGTLCPRTLRDPEVSEDSYRQSLKTFLRSTSVFSALEVFFLRECAI